ncbi:MAG: phenylalanine--tRNA ligase subunit beta [Thaumarchaeota archaeon]|nr:phenylalanine--tRNA ligase subunit beta [Nitrososphaerota archaeon]
MKLYFDRLTRLVGADRKRVLARLPYIGLDIESRESDSVRVEYSPNRPDLATDYGIAKALRGILGIQLGLPRYSTSSSGVQVRVDRKLARVRPYVACAVARGLKMDKEDVRQLISMQEDLHNGLGRKRRKVAIGLHNLDVIRPPISYESAAPTLKLTPLGGSQKIELAQILAESQTGRTYGHILAGASGYPILKDSKGLIFSFPPIINGNETKVSVTTRNLFIDVTSTDEEAGEDTLAIVCTTLADMGARIGFVLVKYGDRRRVTPDLRPRKFSLDRDLVRKVTGLAINSSEIDVCLRRSRIEPLGRVSVLAPRYRIDLLHPVDLAEEVALGYGIDRIEPAYPPSPTPGSFNSVSQLIEKFVELMTSSGLTESMGYELLDELTLYQHFGRPSNGKIEVENPRSIEHAVLRDSVLPSLMGVLSRNVKEEYPQRVFEVGRVYNREEEYVRESWHLGVLIAHAQAGYSEAKSYLDAFFRTLYGKELRTHGSSRWGFLEGRCASIEFSGGTLGHVGEITPGSIAAFGVNLPVVGFELDLTSLLERETRAEEGTTK